MTYITIIAIITQLYRFKRPTRYGRIGGDKAMTWPGRG